MKQILNVALLVKTFKNNAYIFKYQNLKPLWEFIFENVYCPEFVK